MPARPSIPALLAALALAALAPARGRADGAPVNPAPLEAECRPGVFADGRGGAIVAWKTSTLRVGAARVNAAGLPAGGLAFAPEPLPLALELEPPLRALAASDSELTIASDVAATGAPALTRVGSDGLAAAGFPVALPMPLRHEAIVAGRGGRTLLVAKDSDATSFWTVRAAIVDARGGLEFAIQLSSPLMFFNADALDAVSDGAGGLIAAIPYYDFTTTGSKDLAIFRLAADGSRPWGDVPRPLVAEANDQVDVHLVADGAGGAILAWTDPRSPTRGSDIFAQRVDSAGVRVLGWPYFGLAVCDAPGPQSQPRVTRDGLDGMWVVWFDRRAELAGDLRYSHVLGNGTLAPGFTSSGAVLCDAPGAQCEAAVAGDGAGGFFAVWRDERSGEADVYVQHVRADGLPAPGFEPGGRALCTAAGVQDQPAVAAVAGGRVVVAWRDARAETTRVYAAGVEDPGTAGAPAPRGAALSLAPAGPARGEPRFVVSLPGAGPAALELWDVAGRLRARADLMGPLAAGPVTLRPREALAPGLYLARLSQGGARRLARVAVLR